MATQRTAMAALTRQPWRFLASRWPLCSLGYLLASLPFCLVAVLVVIGLVYAPGAWRVLFGALGLLLIAVCAAAGPRFERWRLRLVDPAPLPPADPATGRMNGRVIGYAMASLLALWWIDLAMAALTAIAVALITAPLQPGASLAVQIGACAGGVVLLVALAYPITAWAGARAAMSRAILAPADARIGALVQSRARLVDAFEIERRRIERDLHDGAQQRLVALTMSLGLARLDLPAGSPAAYQVDRAQEQAQQALAELRELIRGIHPYVLTDRGLTAAVVDLTSRSVIPVEVDFALVERLPPALEVAAYYAACEALANVAKHSRAGHAWVRGWVDGGLFVLEVRDDGVGGADPGTGSGLLGLADRISILDGRLLISTPAGGPTVLRVEIPCPPSG
jgi:signal transduction histidine kinase